MEFWKNPSRSDTSETVRSIRRHLEAVIQPIPLETLDGDLIEKSFQAQRGNRQFHTEFAIIKGTEGLQLVAETELSPVHSKPRAMIWFWNNHLWPLYSLTFWWEERGVKEPVSFRGFFLLDSEELEILRTKMTRVILLSRGRCVAGVELNLQIVAPQLWLELDPNPPYQAVCDAIAAKAWVESQLVTPQSVKDEQEFSWSRRLEKEVGFAIRLFYSSEQSDEVAKERGTVEKSVFAEFFAYTDNPASHVYCGFEKGYLGRRLDPSRVPRLLNELSEAPYHRGFVNHLMRCAWFSGKGTARGQQIRSLELDGAVKPISLDSMQLGERCQSLWERIPFDFPLYYHLLIGTGSCPMDVGRFVENAPIFQGDVKDGEDFVRDLLLEATSLKQWTIPFGAYVQLEAGDFKAVKIYEIGHDIACVFVNAAGEYFLVWVNPLDQVISFTHTEAFTRFAVARYLKETGSTSPQDQTTERGQQKNAEFVQRIELGLKIPLAAIVRDFWVIEERERVFGIGELRRKSTRLRSDWGEQVITYLPRIRYIGDIQKGKEELNLAARKAHFVVGHLRKVLHASDDQVLLARKYGIVVPEGFTFIRPHRRGDKAQERIYRSRSALQCIRALEPSTTTSERDNWFQYELNVRNWLGSHGYEVDHLAANRNGDGGVDIQASKGEEHLLVQCKYWHKGKVGPNVIREMIGTLQGFPKGSRGVIITTTDLTFQAKRLAVEHRIQFIENTNFRASIQARP